MPPLVLDVMEAQRAALLRADEAAMRQMAARWLDVEQRLLALVDALAQEIAGGEGPLSMWQLTRLRRYITLQEQIARELAQYAAYVESDVARRQLEAGLQAIDQSALAINAAASDGGIQLQFDRLPVSSVERMVGLAGDGSPLRDILASASRVGPEALANELIQGVALGLNPREIARRAMRQGLAQSFTRMLTIARTEVLRVARQTTLDGYRHSRVVRAYRRVASKSQRTCVACLALDGEIYPLDRPFEEHVNGRCTLVPILVRGEPIEYEKGPAWFAKQPVAIQQQMMGPGRWELWRQGRVTWADLVTIHESETWGNSPQVTPLDALRRRAGVPAPARGTPRTRRGVQPRAAQPATPARVLPKPAGEAVSKALKLPTSKKLAAEIAPALAAVDQVHGDGQLPEIPIKATAGQRRVGVYRYQRSPYTGRTVSQDIGVSTKGTHKSLTLVHEIGHFLDFEQIRIEAQVLGRVSQGSVDANVNNFLAAAKASKAYQQIQDLAAGRTKLVAANDPNYEVRGDWKFCRYLSDPTELWARAYAQYVAVRSGNTDLMESLVESLLGARNGTNYPLQWEQADFEPIKDAIDALFRAKGWIVD